MANINSVSYRNFDRAFIFGLKEGVAKYANVIVGRGGEGTRIFPCKGDHSYTVGSQLTPATFMFSARVLHGYVEAVKTGKASQKNLFMVLPDDCAIRFFEIKNALQALLDSDTDMEFDEIVDTIADKATKDWMSDDWKQSIVAFSHAFLESVSAGINIGVMKHTNLYAWELRPTVRGTVPPFKAGDKLTIENGVIDGVEGWKVENNRVSGENLEVSARAFGNEENDRQITRYYIPREGQGVDITNLRKADEVLRKALPHREVGEVCEASDF